MDAESSEQQANFFVDTASERLNAFELDIRAAGSNAPMRLLWDRARELGETIRTASAVDSADKAALQGRLTALMRMLREEQRRVHKEIERTRKDIEDSLTLAAESVREASTTSDVQEVRSDLAVLRKRITSLEPTIPRSVRTKLWEDWQETNRGAWQALVALWQTNEQMLAALLQTAERHLERGRTRQAREQIKAFHEAIASLECSHREAKALRLKANGLWQRCVDQGREQREQYVAYSRRRLDHLRREVVQNERSRAQLRAEIAALERQVSAATTGVGHALSRGQLSDALRRSERLDAGDRRLAAQISEIEEALEIEATPAG